MCSAAADERTLSIDNNVLGKADAQKGRVFDISFGIVFVISCPRESTSTDVHCEVGKEGGWGGRGAEMHQWHRGRQLQPIGTISCFWRRRMLQYGRTVFFLESSLEELYRETYIIR